MFKIYNTDIETNEFKEIKEFKKGSWINIVNPSEEEILYLCKNLKIDQEFIKYALDYEEKARIDYEEDEEIVLFIIDVPIIEKDEETEMFTTMPVGMIFVRHEFFVTVSLKNNKVIEKLEEGKIKNFSTYKKSRFLFQIMYINSAEFLLNLKQINKETELAEYRLRTSMKNKELLKLLSLEKSLVYFTTSLKSDEVVMEKTLKGKVIKLYEDDEDILEDAIIENKQAIEMSKIYSDILSGTMDAYASIISNNLNWVMKFLTIITIVLSIPTMIFSFWGMNVNLPFQQSNIGFILILVIALILTIIVTWWLNKKSMFD